SDYILLLARTDRDASKKTEGLSLLIVPTDAPGLEITKIPTMAVRASETTQTFYNDVRLLPEALLGEEGRGFDRLLDSLNNERILLSSLSIGIARQALEEGVAYAKTRRAFGRSIGAFQSI